YEKDSPQIQPAVLAQGVPTLGICYGLQLMAHVLGGEVRPDDHREFGAAEIAVRENGPLLRGLAAREPVWMSHGDRVLKPPPGFDILATTPGCPVAAMGDDARKLYGVQFHVEVTHTPRGQSVISNFVHDICGSGPPW